MKKEAELQLYKRAISIWKQGERMSDDEKRDAAIDWGLCCYFHFISDDVFNTLLIKKLIDKEIVSVGRKASIAPFNELQPRINLLSLAIKILKNELNNKQLLE